MFPCIPGSYCRSEYYEKYLYMQQNCKLKLLPVMELWIFQGEGSYPPNNFPSWTWIVCTSCMWHFDTQPQPDPRPEMKQELYLSFT